MRPHILLCIQEKEKHAEKEQCYDIIALSQKLLSYLSTPLKIEGFFFPGHSFQQRTPFL